jgi:signal transduction histidine kinase
VRQLVVRLILTTTAAAVVAAIVAAAVLAAITDRAQTRGATEADLFMIVTLAENTTGQEALLRGIARTGSGREGRLAVHVDGRTVGVSRAPAEVVRDTAAAGAGPGAATAGAVGAAASGTTAIGHDGGTLLLRPVPGGTGVAAVVEAWVPPWRPGGAFVLLVLVLALAGTVGAALGLAAGVRATRPADAELRRVLAVARAHGTGDLAARARADRVPELVELAGALNAVADRVEELRAGERRLVADLSHRLRTPLTALSLDSEAIGDSPAATRVRRALASLEHDVDALIRAARPERVGPARCDVVLVVRTRMAFWSALGSHRGRRSEVRTVEPPAVIPLAADDLAAVLDALLGNVFRYTPDGTDFAVSVVRHAGWITLVVDDAGPGVADPASALRRGVSSGGSTGLGLAIARDAVEATGGTIHVERAALGGARIRLRFAEAGVEHADPHEPRAWRLWR